MVDLIPIDPVAAMVAARPPGQLWRFAAVSRYPDNDWLGDLTDARTRNLDFKLRDADQITLTMSGQSPQIGWVRALLADIVAYRWSDLQQAFVPMIRACVTQAQDQISPTVHTTTFTATDYRGILGRRTLRQALRFDQVEQYQIVSQLAQWGNIPLGYGGAPLGLTESLVAPDGSALGATGVLRDRSYLPGQIIDDAITNMSTDLPGPFDWSVEPSITQAGVFTVWYPQRGVERSSWVAHYGSTISNLDRVETTSNFANYQMVIGDSDPDWVDPDDGSTAPNLIAESFGPAWYSALNHPEGAWQNVSSQSDVRIMSTLQQAADGNRRISEDLEPAYTLQTVPGRWSPEDAWLGDTVRIICRSGYLDVDTAGRITEIAISVDDSGAEVATLTVGLAPASLPQLFAGIDRRLDTIERR